MRFTTHERFHSYIVRWHHKNRKFAVEILQMVAELCQILCMVTYYNSIHIMNIRVTIFCRYCIAFEVMLLVFSSIFLELNALTKFQINTINGALNTGVGKICDFLSQSLLIFENV